MKTRRDKILRQPHQNIPQYSLGGILADTAIGAGTGAIGGGGVLSVPGAIVGGVVGLGAGLMTHFREKKEERELNKYNNALAQQSASLALNAGGSMNNFMNPWMAGYGGVVGNGNQVKLRNKEMVLRPNGKAKSTDSMGVKTPLHTPENVFTLEDGTVIISPEHSAAAAKIARKQKPEVTANNKVINDPKATKLAVDTAKRRLNILKQEYAPIIQADAQYRMAMGGTPMGGDQIPEAANGWIQATGKFLKSDAGKQALGSLVSLAPTMYNTARGFGKPEVMNPAMFQNPMAYDALQSLRDRQPNMTPALQATDSAIAAADENLRSTASGRGQYAAGLSAMTNAGMANKANIYAQGSRERNEYLGQYGNMQAMLGQKMADTNLIVDDLNARNRAAQRNFGAAAAGQLSQFAQVQQQMAGQRNRDEQLMRMYGDWMGLFTGKAANKMQVTPPPVGNITMPTFSTNMTNPNSLRPFRGSLPTQPTSLQRDYNN